MNDRARSPARRADYGLSQAAQVVALWNLGVAQPLYDLLARNPEFFASRGTSLAEAALFAVSLSLVSPLLLVVVPLVAGYLLTRLGFVLRQLVVVVLAAALVLNGVKTLPLPGAVLAAGAVASGALIAWALWRWEALRSWVALLAISALLFPLLFFWRTPAATWSGRDESAGGSAPPPANPVPIVMIIFDELPLVSLLAPDGEIDEKSFPSFAALAREATWYPLATTVSDFTTLAVPALLTGRLAWQDQVPTLADHPVNLFTLLAPHYEIVAEESLTRLCPPKVCAGQQEPLGRRLRGLCRDLGLVYLHIVLPPAWTTRLPPVDQAWGDFGDPGLFYAGAGYVDSDRFEQLFREQARGDRAGDFVRFLGRLEDASSPTLYVYASTLPHVPFDYLPSGRRYSVDRDPAGLIRPDRWGRDEWAILQDHQRHLLQVGFVDRQLGLLQRRLREVGLDERALLVVTADHGASFRRQGYRRTLTATNFAEIMNVPLFLKLPGQRQGRRDERVVETIDVLPTILDVIGARVPLDGRSMLGAPSTSRQHRVIRKHGERGSVQRYATGALRRAIVEAVRLKTERFGSQGFATRFFQLGEFGNLVGKRVAALRPRVFSPVETQVFLPTGDAVFDPAHDFVPAHVTGRFRPPGAGSRHHFAIAVNGTIGAVTREWKESPTNRPGEWSAILPEALFVRGENEIEVFHLRSAAGGMHLTRTDGVTRSPAADLDLLGVRPVRGVVESGFHAPERDQRGRPQRWTDGHARLEIPLSRDRQPYAVRVRLASTGPRGARLRVLFDGSQVLRARLPAGDWTGELPLDPASRRSRLVVEIISDTFVPAELTPGSRDGRRLGVAVRAVRLLEDRR